MKAKKVPRGERIRNFLLQLDTTNQREKDLIDALEAEFDKGTGYKDFIMSCIESRNEAQELRELLRNITKKEGAS